MLLKPCELCEGRGVKGEAALTGRSTGIAGDWKEEGVEDAGGAPLVEEAGREEEVEEDEDDDDDDEDRGSGVITGRTAWRSVEPTIRVDLGVADGGGSCREERDVLREWIRCEVSCCLCCCCWWWCVCF